MPDRNLLEIAEELFNAGELRAAVEALEELQGSEPENWRVAELVTRIHEHLQQIDDAFGQINRENQEKINSARKQPGEHGVFTSDDIDFIKSSASQSEAWNHDDLFAQQAVRRDFPDCKAPVYEGRESCPAETNVSVSGGVAPIEPVKVGSEPVVLDGIRTDVFEDADDEDEVSANEDDEWEIDLDGLQEDQTDEAIEVVDYASEWESLALLDDDIEEDEPEPDDGNIPDVLSQEDKAWQVAAQICEEAGWGRAEATSLIEILVSHRNHNKTRDAIKSLILDDGFTSEELVTAFGVRQEWITGGYSRVLRWGELTEGWPNLSWRLAAKLVRLIRSDSPEEIMQFVEDCFQDWSQRPSLILQFKEFKYYLICVIDHMESVERCWNHRMPLFVDFSLFDEETGCVPGSILWRTLEEMGLLHYQVEQNERLIPYD